MGVLFDSHILVYDAYMNITIYFYLCDITDLELTDNAVI